MNEIYKCGTTTLADVIKSLNGDDEPLMVPDFQRAFVWGPEQIMALVDSLMKGWPFGQIFWVTMEKKSALAFSPRPFYSQVPHGSQVAGQEQYRKLLHAQTSDKHRLVLDGQQRLQSIALAFCKTDGIVMDQVDWIEFKNKASRKRKRSGTVHPRALLYVNANNLFEKMRVVGNNLAEVDFTKTASHPILEWVFQEDINTQWWNVELLPKVYHQVKGVSFPLEQLWRNPDASLLQLTDEAWRPVLKILCDRLIEMQTLSVPFTSLSDESEVENSLDFNEIILNVFTRLNRGGTQLTRDDISLSWIKRHWVTTGEYKSGEICLKNLQKKLADNYQIVAPIDQLVYSIVSIWMILERDAKPVSNSDLMDGKTLGCVAQAVSKNWNLISQAYYDVADLLKRRGLFYQHQYYSFQVITLLVAWQVLGKMWAARNLGNEQATTQAKFNQVFISKLELQLDRFIFAGQWANAWNLQYPFTTLSSIKKEIDATQDIAEAEKIMLTYFDRVFAQMLETAKSYIMNLSADNYSQVSRYRLPLWIWQRLDTERGRFSKTLATCPQSNLEGLPHVDHCVSHNWWCTTWEKDSAKYAVEKDSQRYLQSLSAVNQIGNCNLLVNSLNCSKGKKSLSVFLGKLLESGQVDICCRSLLIPTEMILNVPAQADLQQLLSKINERTQRIKGDLIRFLEGQYVRA